MTPEGVLTHDPRTGAVFTVECVCGREFIAGPGLDRCIGKHVDHCLSVMWSLWLGVS